jgi:hypothetical protein
MFAAFAGLVGAGIASGANRSAQKKALKIAGENAKAAEQQTRQLLIGAGVFASVCVLVAVVKRGRR